MMGCVSLRSTTQHVASMLSAEHSIASRRMGCFSVTGTTQHRASTPSAEQHPIRLARNRQQQQW
eukprot:9558393-Alexandrium_andersonii.AAC.1